MKFKKPCSDRLYFLLAGAVLCVAGCASAPDFSSRKVLHTRYDGTADDLLSAGLGKSGLGVATPPAVREPKSPTAAELRRRAIHANYRALADIDCGGRLRRAVRAEHRSRRQGHARRRQDRGRRVPDLSRRRQRTRQRHADGPGAARLQSQGAVHRDRFVLRLARNLRRDRHRGRMGPQARLRRRLHRQGDRHRLPRPRLRYGQPDHRRARRRRSRRTRLDVHRRAFARRAHALPARLSEPRRREARPLAAQPREGLGPAHAGGDRLRLLCVERPAGRARRTLCAGEHDRHRLERLERRRRGARRRRAGRARADRRRRRLGAERLAAGRAGAGDRAGLADVCDEQPLALRPDHAVERLLAMRVARRAERRRAAEYRRATAARGALRFARRKGPVEIENAAGTGGGKPAHHQRVRHPSRIEPGPALALHPGGRAGHRRHLRI